MYYAKLDKYVKKADINIFKFYIDLIQKRYESLDIDPHWKNSPNNKQMKTTYKKS